MNLLHLASLFAGGAAVGSVAAAITTYIVARATHQAVRDRKNRIEITLPDGHRTSMVFDASVSSEQIGQIVSRTLEEEETKAKLAS
jgi:ABC-type anion transport system duplicated permease subunit